MIRSVILARFAALALVLPPGVVDAQSSVITGRVYDSLRMAPLAGVRVQLSGTAVEARTGADGTYRLTTALRGRRTLTLAEPRLDRLLGTITGDVDLTPGNETQFDFFIPRRPPPPSTLCRDGSAESAARGGVVGVVRDSASGLAISGAVVAAWWLPDSPDSGGAFPGVKIESGDDGGFLLCNLPTDRPVSLLARTLGRVFGLEGLRPGPDSIVDLDLVASPLAKGAMGRIRGRVIDSANRAALAGADIMLLESGLHATSSAGGDFEIDQVVPGRIAMVVRRIGYRPKFLDAELRMGGTATVVAVLPPAPVRLEEVETRVEPLDRDFLERRRLGLGKFWDEAEIRRYDGGTITALLGRKVEIRELKGVMVNYSRSRNCPIPVVMDGVLWGAGEAIYTRPHELGRIEYYAGPAQVPNDFQSLHLRAGGFRCGLLVLWTRGRD